MLVNKRTRFAGLAKTLRDHCSLVEVNAGQKDHKLVSALSSQYCRTASYRLLDDLGKVYESAVSSLVPISIVEATKGIDVAQDGRDRLSRLETLSPVHFFPRRRTRGNAIAVISGSFAVPTKSVGQRGSHRGAWSRFWPCERCRD
jgi:hypothetical protein